MPYLSQAAVDDVGLKHAGKNLKISDKASFYDADKIIVGDNSRVDDFCVISGSVKIGRYCHITPMCLIAGGVEGVDISDLCTLAYGVKVFSQSDDYSGESLTNSLISKEYKKRYLNPFR